MKENRLFVPFTAFVTTILVFNIPWFGVFMTIPFIIACAGMIDQ